ncbi:hypothetical protein ABD05_01840 [Burkholderia pyrrocinia]|nr:hypothetical protein ABD05_01840 [Burkholderia pyrrocinia]
MRQARNGRSTGRGHPAGIRPYTRSRATRNPHPAQETGRKPYMTPLYRTAPMRFERRSQA